MVCKFFTKEFLLFVLLLCVSLTSEAKPADMPLVEKERFGLFISFRYNSSDVDLDYLDNRAQLKVLDSLFVLIPESKIDSIVIKTVSSPEGTYRYNMNLASSREKSLMHFVCKRYPTCPVSKVVATEVREAWPELCVAVDSDPTIGPALAAKIKEIATANVPVETKKARMNALPEFKYLKEEVYPRLRYTSVVAYPSPEALKELDEPIELEPAPEPEPEPLPEPEPEPVLQPEPQPVPMPILDFTPSRVHILALRTNLAYDLFYMPRFGFAPMWDIQAEFYPLAGHWTYGFQFTSPYWHKWDQHKFFQIRDYRLEARRYFRRSGDYTGFYASTYAEGTKFGIGLGDDDGWIGEGGGAGVQFGYVLPITRKGDLRLEFSAGLGAFFARFDPYVYGNPVTGNKDGYYYYDFIGSADKFIERNHTFTWFGPTSAGISLTYDIIYHTRKEAMR